MRDASPVRVGSLGVGRWGSVPADKAVDAARRSVATGSVVEVERLSPIRG